MPIDLSRFECDQCGACCQALIVEAQWHDADREPRLYEIAGPGITRQELVDGEKCIMLWEPERNCCPFLTDDDGTHKCGIYPTRPLACVCVEAGDAKCQQARMMKGLPLLCDPDGNPPTEAELRASCDDYELDPEMLGLTDLAESGQDPDWPGPLLGAGKETPGDLA